MKKILILVSITLLTGCAKKEWSKSALVNECLKDFNERNEREKKLDPAKIPYFCDCVVDKMIAKYKSEKESENDPEGNTRIGMECATEVLKD